MSNTAPLPIHTRIADYCRANPYSVFVVVAFMVVCSVVASQLEIGELSTTRKAIGGAVAGFYFSLMPLGFRIFD